MIEYNNDIDDSVDDSIYECLTPNELKSFFLFAGAGSGKTRTLVNVLSKLKETHREYFIQKNKKIAVITYTNAAANEITRRLKYDSIFSISTIHSFCWELIKYYTSDIREWLRDNLKIELDKLKEEQNKSRNPQNKTSIERKRKIEIKEDRLFHLDNIQKFKYSPDSDNITKDSLNHNEVITITAYFISNKKLFQQILTSKFPILLIDESQDTKKELIDALFYLQENFREDFALGLFGDTMQRIYTDGKENLGRALPDDWSIFEKKMNHRSQKRIVSLINKIRFGVDQQEQLPRREKSDGVVRFFSVSRTLCKKDIEENVLKTMQNITKDSQWSSESNIMKLILEHHMVAKRLGFETFFNSLYKIDSLRTNLLNGTSESIGFFTKIILPLYKALEENNKFNIANTIKEFSPLLKRNELEKIEDKIKYLDDINKKVSNFYSLWDNDEPTLKDILINISNSKLFKIPNELSHLIIENQEDDLDEKNLHDKQWNLALTAKFSEIITYENYINGESSFGTHQGVKGLQFDRVMVIIDDEESKGFLFKYDKLFGITPLSQTDKKNEEEGKETVIDRAKRLFYVTCSRAKESLAIVAYSDDPETLKDNLVNLNWFREDEVEVLK